MFPRGYQKSHAKVAKDGRGGVIAAISDVGCIILNWRRDCLRKGRQGGIKEVQKCKSAKVQKWERENVVS